MQKLTCIVIGIILFSSARAQFNPGEKYLSGTFNIGYNNREQGGEDYHSFSFYFSPSFSKFKTAKKATGFRVLFTLLDNKSWSGSVTTNTTNSSLGLGVFNQHILPLGGRFYLSLENGINATYINGEVDYSSALTIPLPPPANSHGYTINAYLTPEAGVKLSNRWVAAINFNNILQVGFQRVRQESINGIANSGYKETTVYLNSGISDRAVGQLGVRFAWRL